MFSLFLRFSYTSQDWPYYWGQPYRPYRSDEGGRPYLCCQRPVHHGAVAQRYRPAHQGCRHFCHPHCCAWRWYVGTEKVSVLWSWFPERTPRVLSGNKILEMLTHFQHLHESIALWSHALCAILCKWVCCMHCVFTDSAPPSGTNSAKQSPSAQHRAMGQQPPSYLDRYTKYTHML